MGVPEGRRFFLTCAMTTYEYAPDMNREELRENLARMVELFCGRFGYEHVPLGESLIADELTTGLRGFSTHSDRRESDYIAVYLTGHGDLRGDREHVLLTRDSHPDDLHGKAVPTADIGRLMLADTKRPPIAAHSGHLLLRTRRRGVGRGGAEVVNLAGSGAGGRGCSGSGVPAARGGQAGGFYDRLYQGG